MSEVTRKLASVRRIDALEAIPGADRIEVATIGGWKVVCNKGLYSVGDLVVYYEIDSFIPTEVAPFLTKEGHEPKEYKGVKGERLRTVKLRKQVSQGLLMPISEVLKDVYEVKEGDDLTSVLGIQKWEAELPAQLSGDARGPFPSDIPKTDQERVQNINYEEYLGKCYEVTEKLHGSSCTFYLDNDGDFHVCSRNLDLKFSESNSYWKAAIKYDVERKMKEGNLFGYAIQGELCGAGINGNNYNLYLDFFVFDVYGNGSYMVAEERQELISILEMKHVPIIHYEYLLTEDRDNLIKSADGTSDIADCKREGFVFKAVNGDRSFKVVSQQWLLKYE